MELNNINLDNNISNNNNNIISNSKCTTSPTPSNTESSLETDKNTHTTNNSDSNNMNRIAIDSGHSSNNNPTNKYVTSAQQCPNSPSLEAQKQRLNHLIELIADQDAKLNRLTTLHKLVKEQENVNLGLSNELKTINKSINEKDGQLREHMNKVDNLNRQLNNFKRMRANRIRKSGSINNLNDSTNCQNHSNISTTPSTTTNSIERRVSFDPLALLLDAALEGELDLVIQTSKQVPDLNASHDECVTALHNAAVAGHYEVAKYLIEAGCDINIQDSDGWTPLHCAASCNNLPLAKLLIENGALIYATTSSDHSTPAMKCEKNEPNFDDCYNYLLYIQNNLGVINDGIVYALYDYEAQEEDELSFKTDEKLTVLRKDDSKEQEWWWAQKQVEPSGDTKVVEYKEGYIPRNLVGLYRRIREPNKKDTDNVTSSTNPNDDSKSSTPIVTSNGISDQKI